MQRANGTWWKLGLVCLCSALWLLGCGDDEDTNTTTDTATAADVVSDTTTTNDAILATGETVTYRFVVLELTQPSIPLRGILNTLIKVNVDAQPGEAERVNVLLQFSDWDLGTDPPALMLAGGAGEEVLSGADVSYRFLADPAPVFVPAELRTIDGLMKIQNDTPTSLAFPVIVGDATFMLPLENILLETCYGHNTSCAGTDDQQIYGTLTGGIREAAADGILVETPSMTLPLGDVLRAPDLNTTCTIDTDCDTGRVCNPASNCERAPDTTIEGEPAFSLAGRYIADVITYTE